MPDSEKDRLLLPASTGIQGKILCEAAVTLDLLALASLDPALPIIEQLKNPSQKEAFLYGSAFSRGVLIREPGVDLIHVSGTAAIDETGASLFPDDVLGQMQSTLDKIEALLDQEGAALKDICAATLFVKRPEDAGLCLETAQDRGLMPKRIVCVVADICRQELLCEMDAIAVRDHSC